MMMANHRHKKIVKMAKGYRGRTNCFRIAVQRVEKALQYAYRDRKVGLRLCGVVVGYEWIGPLPIRHTRPPRPY